MTSLDALPDNAARGSLTLRAVLFQLHLYLGLTLCLVLSALGLTGSLLVYDDAIEALLAPPPKALTAGAPQSPGAIVAAASREGFAPAQVTFPGKAGEAALVRLVRLKHGDAPSGRPGQGPQIFIDPVSLAVLETRKGPAVPLLRFAHDLHGNLLAGPDGRRVVGWLGLAMLGLGLSGIVLWWPKPGRWRAAFLIRPNARGFALLRDLHGAAGIWGLTVFLLVSLSGVAIAFPQTAGALFQAPGASGGPPGRGAVEAAPAEFDAAASLAMSAVPDARLLAIAAPRNAGQLFRVTLASDESAEGAPAIIVMADPAGARVTEIRDPARLGAGARLLAWQRPLHAGQGLGPLWRAAVFAVGFLPLLFTITGVWMWVMKRRGRRGSSRS